MAPGAPPTPSIGGLDRRIGLALSAGSYVAVILFAAGVTLMLASGVSPLAGGPPLDVARLPAGIVAGEPPALLWLGLLVVLITPATRVGLSLVTFLRLGDRPMAVVAALVLAVVLAGVVAGTSGA